MKRILLVSVLGSLASSSVPVSAAPVDILNRKPEKKPRNENNGPRVDKPRDSTPPNPTPSLGDRPSQPGRGGGIGIGRPVVRPGQPRPDWDRDRNRDRDRDRNRPNYNRPNYNRPNYNRPGYNRPSFNWNFGTTNRTVIVDRPVYIPYGVPAPVYGSGYYDPYDYSRYYYDREYERRLDELEVIARQIKTALRLDPVLGPFNLDTDTVGESIEVEGWVDSPSQLQRVLDVARSIDQDVRVVITRVRLR